VPGAIADFVDLVAGRYAFQRVISAHFNTPAAATPADLQRAFAFAYKLAGRKPGPVARGASGGPFSLGGLFGAPAPSPVTYPKDDMAVLNAVNSFIVKVGVANR
jgi:hypothetical protein